MLKNLKKRRAQLNSAGELTEAKEYNFFPVSFEMPKVNTTASNVACGRTCFAALAPPPAALRYLSTRRPKMSLQGVS